ncbi:penicillin amidase [Sphingomonas guangdongensis]|uniref:Penicillin amidase n=1 Tax=Sphingomonas guangdongensis TaxID=1141890 RepID=A0A285QYM2_9SPHN|nr:penicillin acylase family protein [Sphingomonas guangdongensis]SOB86926.1 penicillin amidase [Sphingomonas guangdongensis]
MLLSPAPPAQIATAQPATEQRQVAGLAAPAEIVVDRHGLAHIYAASERDAYFLQGYNVARDRLWQIDLWRKRGLGRLSASFGPAYVRQDRAARLFLYRGSMAAEWTRYAPGSQARYAAFAAGINAYVDEVLAGTRPLPPEFRLTGSRPERWDATDAVRIRSNTLVSNAKNEVLRARVACAAGIDADRLRVRLYPEHRPVLPAGLDPCVVTADVLADYMLATQEVSFAGVTAPAAGLSDGSNNWVVAGRRTATGRPILANDPHRALQVPSIRYVVHLEAPGLSLIGAGEPAVPGVSFGHNDRAAFGLTIFNTDQEDLQVHDLRPGRPDEYRYKGGWRRMRTVREVIPVKSGRAVAVTLKFTHAGPVLKQDAAAGRGFSLRTVWMEPGASGYAAASWLASAKSWSDFARAAAHWGTPPLNLVWADVSGETGWIASGLAPQRRGSDGLLPVPGDGRYDWQGFRRDLPQVRNPVAGWLATANEMNQPAGAEPAGYEWADRSRIDRISQVLAADSTMSVDDAAALQNDTVSFLSARLRALLDQVEPRSDRSRAALALVRGWNGDVRADSAAAAIYETWVTQHLSQTLVVRVAPVLTPILDAHSPDAALRVLETRDLLLGPDPNAAVRAVLTDSLEATVAQLTRLLGPDMTEWRWERLHTLDLKPAVASLAPPDLAAKMRIGPVAVSGSSSTPGVTGYRGSSFAAVHGASVRMVMDVGNWDASRFLNMPGLSGDPDSPHYRDQLPGWLSGQYAPLSFSRAAVNAVAEQVIRLEPRR